MQTNNFFIFVLLVAIQPASAEFFLFILSGLILLLLSDNRLSKLSCRLHLWPLTSRQSAALKLGGLALSPITWLAGWVIGQGATWQTLLPVALVLGVKKAGRYGSMWWDDHRLAAMWPIGFCSNAACALGLLHIRQMFFVVDTYVAMFISMAGVAYRLTPAADRDAFPVLATVVALALSTQVQSLFGMDGEQGRARLRLYPIAGWRLIASKAFAHTLVGVCLTAPLDAASGLSATFAALAVGVRYSVLEPVPHQRFRFAAGRLLPAGLLQIVAVFVAGLGMRRADAAWLVAPMLLCVLSVCWYGRKWDVLR